MKAGRLRQTVIFQQNVPIKLPSGQLKKEWVDIASVRCGVKHLSGRELISANAEMSEVTVRVWMRYRPDINSTCRMVWREQIYDIQSVIPDEKLTRLELLCKQGVKQS
ncbi:MULTISPECIES: phage head closure protein [Proteus]|uniref:phage head closure protein n=1 Tax=Proteus TaxID=583 RepID=UPI0018E40DE2|nr:phage head closure protein [Proteus sp. PR00224]MBI6340173.1 phage head closure protein [Proteus sp. PR00224]